MGESLDKLGHVGALIGYAFSLKPLNFFITDGINWHYYSPSHSSYEPVATLNLREADPIEAALQMVQWLDAGLSGHGTSTPNNKPAEPKQISKSAPHQIDVETMALEQRSRLTKLKAKLATSFTDLTQLHLMSLKPGQKPQQLRLPNGTIKSILTWKDILLETCYLVLETNPELRLPLPDKAGKKRFLFSRAKPELGSSTQASYQGKALFIGTHSQCGRLRCQRTLCLSSIATRAKVICIGSQFLKSL